MDTRPGPFDLQGGQSLDAARFSSNPHFLAPFPDPPSVHHFKLRFGDVMLKRAE
jgi:hypothetical protein